MVILPEREDDGPPAGRWVRDRQYEGKALNPVRIAEVNGRATDFRDTHLVDSEVPGTIYTQMYPAHKTTFSNIMLHTLVAELFVCVFYC